MMMPERNPGLELIVPDWPAPGNISACCTTRLGGISKSPFDSLNLGQHVGDEPLHVEANRQHLIQALDLPSEPLWLDQVHSAIAVDTASYQTAIQADAMVCREFGQVAAIMTADCLPVLFCSRNGREVAAVHCGWRGLLDGILDNTLRKMQHPPAELMAWLGPAIGPQAYEVDDVVYRPFIDKDKTLDACFRARDEAHWLMDIYAIAGRLLSQAGIGSVYGGGFCTFTDSQRFFSYRRDGITGRMASLIWISDNNR